MSIAHHQMVIVVGKKLPGNNYRLGVKCSCFQWSHVANSSLGYDGAYKSCYQGYRKHCIKIGVWLYEWEKGHA